MHNWDEKEEGLSYLRTRIVVNSLFNFYILVLKKVGIHDLTLIVIFAKI